ncbi:MAG TPA: cell division protein ZapA [Candidatus Coprenecus stercoripullorum]|mgnify:FL=1|nr:cell division protein ZapA [Candidatus Coprenecus stercoripullorum]
MVKIAGRPYPFDVELEDGMEELVRAAAAEINERFDRIRERYIFKDDQDLLVNLLVQYVIQIINMKRYDLPGRIVKEIQSLDRQLGDYIESNIK